MSRLIAKIYEHANFRGQYRWVVYNTRNLSSELGFNDKVSSIRIYRGNHYRDGDTMRFFEHANFTGGYLDLGPGFYSNIHIQPYSFGDKISSIDVLSNSTTIRPITVRLRVRLYEHVNFGGQYRDILASENNLNDVGFNDKVSSIRVYAGEDYVPGWVCDFFQHANYSGGKLQGGAFGPGASISNIVAAPFSFNDVISSVRIYNRS